MIDHVSFAVNDFQKSLHFYDTTLKILGYDRLFNVPEREISGYGKNGKPSFWINAPHLGKESETIGSAKNLHIAFLAPDENAVREWHKKCLELGGTDNGQPGPRPQYHPGYFGAFIIDPNGWRIEACLHSYHEKI